MRKIALKDFIYKIDGPENIVNNKVEERMVIMPADEQGIYSQKEIKDATVFIIHF